MRFNLRILLLLTISIAALPLVATAITFYIHEPPQRRDLGIVIKPEFEFYVLGPDGPTFVANSEELHFRTRVYLHLRQIFCAPAIKMQQIDKLFDVLTDKTWAYAVRQLQLGEEWQDVSDGIQVRAHEIRVQMGGKSVRYPLRWRPSNIEIGAHPKYVVVPWEGSYPPHYLMVLKTDDGPIILTTLYSEYSHVATADAGAFFFKTLLALSVTVLIAFLWALRRFSLRKAPPEITENPVPNVIA